MDHKHKTRLCIYWSIIILNLLIPLEYYFVREDKNDERFAWRMFSSDSLGKKEVQFFGCVSLSNCSIPISVNDHFTKTDRKILSIRKKIIHDKFLIESANRMCKTKEGNTFFAIFHQVIFISPLEREPKRIYDGMVICNVPINNS